MTTLISDTPPTPEKELTFEEFEVGDLRAWSFSALGVFEECPYRSYIGRVKKIPEPSGPAAERGTMIHDLAEAYVKGDGPFPSKYYKHFQSELEELRLGYANGTVEVEGEWAFTQQWQPTRWIAKDTWVRIKLDAYVKQGDGSARVIDYKSGKKIGNEIKHSQQCLLYAIAAFLRDPELEFAQTELWYVDQNDTTIKSYTRKQALHFLPKWHSRGVAMTTCEEFDPNPSKWNCRWCAYKEGDHPECRYGVK